MFDGLAHGLPFVASEGVGITVDRNPDAFADGLTALAKEYDTYAKKVNNFKEKLKWDVVERQHASLYQQVRKQ